MVLLNQVRDNFYDEENDVKPEFKIGYGTLAGEISKLVQIRAQLS